MHELEPLIDGLHNHRPRRRRLRQYLKRAAVALILRETRQGAEVLLVERARRPGDPWSGDMAFPGGRVDAGDDASGARAACRETAEEIGLHLTRADGIGRLSDRITLDHRRRAPMVISPFVYRLSRPSTPVRNEEIAALRWVALGWLAEPAHRGIFHWSPEWPIRRINLRMPCYECGDGQRLWGLTLAIIDELLGTARCARG